MQVDKVVSIDGGRKAPRSKRGLIKIEPLNEDDRQCLEYWNSFGIMKHKETKIGLHDAIDFALSNFDCEDVKTAITHYATMYHDEDYKYCKYKWALTTFLTHENGLPEFMNDGSKWLAYCNFREQRYKETRYDPPPSLSVGSSTIEDLYQVCLRALKSMAYKDYMKTEHWQHFRREALKHYNNSCQLCNAQDRTLDVHHKTYANRGRETFNDVIVLCRHCHDTYHHNRDQCTCQRCSGGEGEHEYHADLL